jgi:hypothetical protein
MLFTYFRRIQGKREKQIRVLKSLPEFGEGFREGSIVKRQKPIAWVTVSARSGYNLGHV